MEGFGWKQSKLRFMTSMNIAKSKRDVGLQIRILRC